MQRILIAEDEVSIARLLELELKREGFVADIFHDGQSALIAALQGGYDLLLLDIMMPKMDGVEVLTKVREQSRIPVIMLTAKGALEDKVMALGLGADDYIVKPFAMAEVTARVRSALRRATPASLISQTIANGKLTVDKETYTVSYDGAPLELTKKEYELVVYFMEHLGKVCSRQEIIKDVWGFDYIGDTNLIDVYIRYLRSKIDNVYDTCFFKTVRGFGYVMEEQNVAQE
ncbi:MAG: response regulator transcription factor [Clostridia bacterium]|nr:response regulator transcription factor [Clostridia bacterium]